MPVSSFKATGGSERSWASYGVQVQVSILFFLRMARNANWLVDKRQEMVDGIICLPPRFQISELCSLWVLRTLTTTKNCIIITRVGRWKLIHSSIEKVERLAWLWEQEKQSFLITKQGCGLVIHGWGWWAGRWKWLCQQISPPGG